MDETGCYVEWNGRNPIEGIWDIPFVVPREEGAFFGQGRQSRLHLYCQVCQQSRCRGFQVDQISRKE